MGSLHKSAILNCMSPTIHLTLQRVLLIERVEMHGMILSEVTSLHEFRSFEKRVYNYLFFLLPFNYVHFISCYEFF